jgi:hypothetical protein
MIAVIYFSSDYIGEHADPEYGYMENTSSFFRLLFALIIISLSIFSYEAYKFYRQNRKKELNISLTLIALVLFPVLFFIKYFFVFVF